MYIELFIVLIYLSFAVDFLVIPIDSEASTKSLISKDDDKKGFIKKSVLILVFSINLIFYLSPLLMSLLRIFDQEYLSLASRPVIYLGCITTVLGRVISLFGSYVLRKNITHLTTTSIFKWSRNPIALGMHLTILGLILMIGNWFLFIGLILSIWNIHLKIKIEELYLIKKYGMSYNNYMCQTPRYL